MACGISWAICQSALRCRQITTPAPHDSVLLQAGCPSCHPTNSVKALIRSTGIDMEQNSVAVTVCMYVGQILTVETFGVPCLHGRLDGRVTRWTESIDDDSPYAFAVRVFHCRSLDVASRHFNEHALVGLYRRARSGPHLLQAGAKNVGAPNI